MRFFRRKAHIKKSLKNILNYLFMKICLKMPFLRKGIFGRIFIFMKYRDYKQFAAGHYYHVYNRGNNEQDIFRDDEDYVLFLLRLRENLFPNVPLIGTRKPAEASGRIALPEGAFSLVCYCLMPNHFHLLIQQCTDLPLSKLISKVCTSYAKCFNANYGRVGQVFQDQFKAIAVEDNDYLIWLSAYIHSNPSVARLVKNIEDWPWSSYPEYLRDKKWALCDPNIIKGQFDSVESYSHFVLESANQIREKKNLNYFLFD